MDRIRSLYKSFSKSEQRVLKVYLEAFHSKGVNRQLELIQLVEKQPDITLGEAAKHLYGDAKSKAFIMMKGRLLEKMVEFLTLSINPGSPKLDKESPFTYNLIEFRKLMQHAAVLRARKLNELAKDCLVKAADIAAACDCPELEIDALLRLRAVMSGRVDQAVLDDVTIRIRNAIPRQNADVNGVISYQRFLELHTLRLSDDASKKRFLEEHIPRLEASLSDSYSVRADYYLKALKINYFSLVGEYEECRETILSVVQLVSDHDGIRNRQRLATPYLQLGLLEMKFHNYDAALEALEKCQSYLKEGSMGHFRAALIRLYAYIYKGDEEQIAHLRGQLEQWKNSPAIKRSRNTIGMFAYLVSVTESLKGNHIKAWQALQEITELNFDKSGWLTGIRIFEIMLLVEMEEFDIASQKLENLRKHLSRYDADARATAIFRVLTLLERAAWSFSEVKKADEWLDQVRQDSSWTNLGYEVIRFDKWYEKMAKEE